MVDYKKLFDGVFDQKRVLVTGHTGFKGAWLSFWLHQLGANVQGFSKYFPSDPCLSKVLDLENLIGHRMGDVCNKQELQGVFDEFKPEIVFHLAAQPLVRAAYQDPKLTFDTNLGGTVNVLECLRESDSVKSALLITSDKCYENVNWEWGYRENDRLGGHDPYSASKACAEIAASAYMRSFFESESTPFLATTRAGNVIGGGDWALDRIIPDAIKSWSSNETLKIRYPHATRPWQHVLEPLSGYLWLAACLWQKKASLKNEAFNFGPHQDVIQPVQTLVEALAKDWPDARIEIESADSNQKEANLLKLSCDKALHRLDWQPVLSFDETMDFTSQWYRSFYTQQDTIVDFTKQQIETYISHATERGLAWVK